MAWAAMLLLGSASGLTFAQIVAAPGSGAQVIQTQNGLNQVNIARPSGSGVSVNNFSQFDVPAKGAILNNSPVNIQSQLAGYISGNGNLTPGNSAKIIVNQVMNNAPSQLHGYLEVAGPKAEVVVANPNGLVVDGAGFINTSRVILTTGTPNYGPNGSLAGFDVTGGNITVQGAGLNATNVDQVDLLARAIQINAAVYANNLNAIAGSNRVDHDTLAVTPIAGNGTAPAVAIDVSALGGMYANRIFLTSNEYGVGVSTKGVLAAQAGDLTLQSNGQLVLAGTTNASGSINASARDGISNSGTTYAQGNVIATTSGALNNSGTLAAQQNTSVSAGSVASTGTLGAGVSTNGAVAQSGDLTVMASGAVSATGQNVAGASATLSGSSINLAGSQTAANGDVSLSATAGDLNLSGATTSAGSSVVARAAGALVNDHGALTAGGSVTLDAGRLSNQGGQVSAQGPLIVQSASQIANQSGSLVSQGAMQVRGGIIANNQGTMQSAAALSVSGTSLDNTAGRTTSLNGDGLTLSTTGQLTNVAGATATGAQGGVIGGNGAVTLQGGSIANHGAVSAQTDLQLTSASLDNSNGTLAAAGNATVNAGTHLANNGGSITAGQRATLSATTLDNSAGAMQAAQLSLNATNLVNHAGIVTQTGSGPMTVAVSGALDNSNGGTLQTNSTDLTLTPATLDNDGGTITHAGNGMLSINAANGAGALSNSGGTIQSNGQVTAQAGSFNNAAGTLIGQKGLAATVGGTLNNANGKLLSNADLTVTSGTLTNDGGQIGAGANETIRTGSLTNNGGSIVAPNLTLATSGTLDNSAGDIEANQLALTATDLLNHSGTITQYGTATMGFNVVGTFDNSNGGTLQSNSTDLTLTPATLINDGGAILAAGSGTLTIAPGNGAGAFSNAGGKIIAAGQIAAQAASLNNANGVLAAQGNLAANIAGDVNNAQGAMRSLGSLSLASGGALSNTNGQIQSGTDTRDASTLDVQAASIDNTSGLIGDLGTGDMHVQGGSRIVNSGGVITGNGNVAVDTSTLVNTNGAQLSGANVAVQADTVDNSAGQIGSLADTMGDVAITTTGAITNTNGQIGASHDLLVTAATLAGGGAYSAADDVAVNVQGNFTLASDLQLKAGHDLTFTLPGTFNNGAALESVNNLNVNAGDIANSGVMMAGGTLTTYSNTLTNTGAIIGGSVSLNANSTLSNVGPTALIGATDSNGLLELLASDIENRDDTTMTDTQATTAIFGLGNVVLAGAKDANGNYTNANLIRNQSALIESAGDMALHADQVTNTRTTMTTTGLNQPVDPNLLTQLGISLSGCTAVVAAACAGQDVGWTTSTPDMIGGVDIEPPHGGQWNSGYQYTTYTGVAVANLIASISPQAQIVAGGNLDASKVGLFQNYWSAVTAVSNIAAPVSLDQNSWQGQSTPQVQITYSGYYHYNNYDNSEHNWTLPFGDAPFVGGRPGGYSQAAPADVRLYALPSDESSFVAGGTLSGTGISIDNTAGNAGIPSMGLAPGQAMSGVNIGGVNGSAGGAKAGTASVNGGSGLVNPVIASATALNVLENLSIPAGGLFSRTTAPGVTYLIATNPAFTNQKSFISSDYYLQQLDIDPQKVEKRLGDGFYEQQLVRNQITSLTGKAVLGPYTDLQSMYEAMLGAGASLAQSLNLPLGMSLSPEQVASLTSNVIIMQTEVVDGQSVLVPVVYLAKSSQQNMNGPLIAATDIDLKNAQTFTNSGTVQAGNTLSIQGNQINNAFGTLQSGGLMSLTTKGNVDLTSASVNAGSLALNAGGDLILNTAVKTVDQISPTGATRTTATLGPIASLNVAGNAVIVTGGNVEQNAGNLNVGGNLGMIVGGDWDLGSVQTGEHKVVERANGVSNTDINRTTGSNVNVGGVSLIGVGGDLTATGANLNLGGGGSLAANGNVTLQAAKATSTIDASSAGSDHHGSYAESMHTADDTLTATTLNAGNSLSVVAGKDISLTGSAISLDKGTATLAAVGNVNVGAATETHVDNSQETHSHSNVVSGKEVASSSNSTAILSQGSMISADAVTITSGKDINVQGSTIVGTNDVSLNATHDVNITTTQDTMQSSGSHQETRTGLGTSGLTVTVGTNKLATTDQASSVTNNASTVGSINGDLSIQAGNTLHVTGSDLVAGGNLAGTAANVIIDAATDTSHQAQTQKTSSSGVTLGLAGSVGDAINNAYSESQAIGHSASSGNDRAAALHGIAAVGDAAMVANGAKALAGGGKPDIGVKVSIGSSKSQSQSSEDQTTQRGSSVQAGGTVAFVATGDGTPGSGNVTIAGSNVGANDVSLAAKNQVNIVNTTDTDSTRSSNSSSSASIGVQYTLGSGYGVSAAMANAHGDANSDASIQNASHVTGANSVTVISGGDTNIIGSQLNGKQIAADVGGNLNITSVQDVTNSAAHQSSAGGGVTISQGGGSASFSAQNGHADSNYQGVNEQAGINAGDAGFNVNVKGNTGLTGAVISSTAGASKNSLTTGTLTYSDIQNQSHYDANSNGISAGVGVGVTGKATGPGSVSGSGGVTPMMSQNESGDSSATTRSAISAGTISIMNPSGQTQDVAGLSRDTTNTNGTVSKTPDVNKILSQQADTMQAAQAAGQVVAQGIGAYADSKRDEALKNAQAILNNPDATQADMQAAAGYLGDFDNWDEGGANRTVLHIAGGALIGGLGGGGFGTALQGATGAGLSAAMAKQLEDIYKGVGSATGSELLGNIAANVVAGVGGALLGGSVGASTASNVELYNQSAHRKPKDLISQVCPAGAQCSDATLNAAIQAQGANADAAAGTLQPNYATVGGGVLSATGSIAANLYDGTVYASGGIAQANPSATSWIPGGSATLGWILGSSNAQLTNEFLNGDANQFFVSLPTPFGANVYAAITHAYGGSTAIELGVSPPGSKTFGVVPWSHANKIGGKSN